MWQEKVDKKTIIAFLLLQCVAPVCFYFAYVYCGNILKTSFNYTTSEVIHHNFIVCLIQCSIVLILANLSYKIHPLLIMKVILIVFSIFMLFCPYWLSNLHLPFELFLVQSCIILFGHCDEPAVPVFL
ncbi:hypothetical protein [Rickettsia endosymbiont of Culicoides newsteadi]|uniref:hypothetical protein n=1 Tax=Rickettsia endosymbiont of Culicoides newsteadi TaxID=1961830 RepID=UPI000BC3D3FF|nr:MFS transporter [Rickettsia endosymbiont of Culicoides newsteadi]